MSYKNLLIVIPENLHRKVKVKLAQEGRTLKEFFFTVLKYYVEEVKIEEKKPDGSKGTGEKTPT